MFVGEGRTSSILSAVVLCCRLGLLEFPLVIALGQTVNDGDDKVGHHGQHKLLKDPGEHVAARLAADIAAVRRPINMAAL